jgi:ornithine carbamoyltransferase
MAEKRHFLTLMDLSSAELRDLIERATELKALRYAGTEPQSLSGKSLAMIFTKASTRTRVSFEAGITQLGGSALFLSGQDTQLGRGEPIEDAARVISSMVDAVMIRTYAHSDVERFAAHSTVPVINGLTDDFHPCQILADLQTFFELRGDISGRKVCWLGDGNNVCHSWMNAARLLDFELVISCPEGYEPDNTLLAACGPTARLREPQSKPSKTRIFWSLMCGRPWGKKLNNKRALHCLDPISSTGNSSIRLHPERYTCIACQHIAMKRSPQI